MAEFRLIVLLEVEPSAWSKVLGALGHVFNQVSVCSLMIKALPAVWRIRPAFCVLCGNAFLQFYPGSVVSKDHIPVLQRTDLCKSFILSFGDHVSREILWRRDPRTKLHPDQIMTFCQRILSSLVTSGCCLSLMTC